MTKSTRLTRPPQGRVVSQPPGGPIPLPAVGPVPHPPAPVQPIPQPPVPPAPQVAAAVGQPAVPTAAPVIEQQPGEQPLVEERQLSESEKVLGPAPGEMPSEGEYLNNAWVDKLPYLMDRLGVPPGAKMKGASFELELEDGRTYDLMLAGHRALDILQQALGQSNECMKAIAQVMQAIQQTGQQIAHAGARIAECEKKLGIEPTVGPVPQPRGQIKQKTA